MSSNIRSFLRSNRTRNKSKNLHTRANSQEKKLQRPAIPVNSPLPVHNISDKLTNINSSCLGGNEKKKATKPLENLVQTKAIADPMNASDHKIEHVLQQHAPKVEIDDDLKNLFGKKELTKAMINQLTQRALTGPMNSNNDDPPRLCTKKHVRDSIKFKYRILSLRQNFSVHSPMNQ